MGPILKFIWLLMLSGFVLFCASVKGDFGDCERVVKDWAASSLVGEVTEEKYTLRDLLFFLHIPRTGGRTYFHCFLKKLYPGSLECPRSYDKLRFDPSKKKCRLLTTHDDYSMMSKLHEDKTSVVTILRNPIDRVFSNYEFSVEVAARFLVHKNLTNAEQFTGRMRASIKGVSTLDIWPWKYLVPWMRGDLFARRDSRKLRGIDNIKSGDPYNMEDVLMPLEKYINDPVAHDIIHNGATFQIAGLTNNSHIADSHKVRHCVQKYKVLGRYVLQVAKKRLDNMLYVGLTEDHRESATMFANMVGSQVISQLVAANATREDGANLKSEKSSSLADLELDNDDHQNSTTDKKAAKPASANKDNMTLRGLMGEYETCISNLRSTQARRRIVSLKRISPANFTKQARLQVPEEVLEQIRSLNSLDLELYEYAKGIFAKQQNDSAKMELYKHAQGIFTNQHMVSADELLATGRFQAMFKYSTSSSISFPELILWATPIVFLSIFIINGRRKSSKVKIQTQILPNHDFHES